jgi:hypothetical protein
MRRALLDVSVLLALLDSDHGGPCAGPGVSRQEIASAGLARYHAERFRKDHSAAPGAPGVTWRGDHR